MKKLKRNSSLFDAAPSLIKEWHPTLNGDRTPRNVIIDYPQKVWWLCSQGHKWQATIKCRLKNNDCPICENAQKKVDLFTELPAMGKNYRKDRRFKSRVTAVIEVPESGHWVYAEMTDFSKQGLCFETEAAIKPGTMVRVKFDKSLVSSQLEKSLNFQSTNEYKTYDSTVMWCKQLDDDDSVSSFR